MHKYIQFRLYFFNTNEAFIINVGVDDLFGGISGAAGA